MDAEQIVEFWMDEKQQALWFQSTPEFDQLLREKFLGLVEDAEAGRLEHWRESPRSLLALILLLDQFPLNIFRGQARGYQDGEIALRYSKYAIEHDYLGSYNLSEILFVILPLMHSENLDDQDLCVASLQQYGSPEHVKYALHHRDIVQQFGRFPHRNEALGRVSSAEELAYLALPDAFKG